MKPKPIRAGLIGLFIIIAQVKGEDTNSLGLPTQPITITNLTGKIYSNINLDHSTPDGVIYTSADKSSEGMIRFSDLSTNDLARLQISPKVLALARQREAEKSRQYAAFNQAVIQAALRQHQADLAPSNAPNMTNGSPIETWNKMVRAVGAGSGGKHHQ